MTRDFSEVMNTLSGIQDYLLQVAIYDDFKPECIIILEKDPPDLLESLDSLRKYSHQRQLRFPLLVNRKFVESSLDSYPLEFLDIITSNYQNLFVKEDILKNLQFDPDDLRLQMEREIKGKWLLIRLSVLERKNTPKQLSDLLFMALSNIIPVLKGICYLYDGVVPLKLEEILAKNNIITNVRFEPMLDWVSGDEATLEDIKQYLGILEGLMQYLEQLDQ
ncbi:MAG: hypothetical protein PHE75_03150 [Candidatus Cloacimonas acidaminovorans]|nr:hypothetical protein [Candidatus Cloacimonas acidaminovorans]HNZ89035.1 hypothetical protein [Candidatus Cloacimonas acidaminovorans]